MRKIFLLLSAALVSMAMQATVVTKNFTISSFSNYGTATVSGGAITDAAAWSGAQLWEWTEGALAYDHVVLEVADHANPILFRIQYSDETNVEKQLPAGINTMAIDITQDIVKGVFVLNWSEATGVDITITGLYLRGAIGEKKEVTLWNTGKTFDDFNWNERITLAASLFDDLHAGDVLEINYTPDEQSYHQFKLHLEYDGNIDLAFLANVIDEYKQININTTENPTQMRFPIISETDVTNIKAQGGLCLYGKYITINSVKLIRHDVLWSGTKATGNWADAVEVAAAKVADLKVGNIICVRVSEIGTEDYPRVTLADGTWTALVDGERYFQGGDEAPMVVEFPVTYKMEQQLRGKNLIVRGVNYTMTDIYVMEGTPVNTVAAYLNVSDAGMATYVLPFNVPALPDGVQAYELTNDGSNVIMATEVNALEADKPVLIIAAEGEYEFVSEEGASDDISTKTDTYANGALIGTYTAIAELDQQTAGNYNYILQKNGDDAPAFYQVKDNSCSVAPYRAYLSCSYPGSTGSSAPARMRLVFNKEEVATSMESIQPSQISNQKILRNGQILIIRDNKMFNVLGQQL